MVISDTLGGLLPNTSSSSCEFLSHGPRVCQPLDVGTTCATRDNSALLHRQVTSARRLQHFCQSSIPMRSTRMCDERQTRTNLSIIHSMWEPLLGGLTEPRATRRQGPLFSNNCGGRTRTRRRRPRCALSPRRATRDRSGLIWSFDRSASRVSARMCDESPIEVEIVYHSVTLYAEKTLAKKPRLDQR